MRIGTNVVGLSVQRSHNKILKT